MTKKEITTKTRLQEKLIIAAKLAGALITVLFIPGGIPLLLGYSLLKRRKNVISTKSDSEQRTQVEN